MCEIRELREMERETSGGGGSLGEWVCEFAPQSLLVCAPPKEIEFVGFSHFHEKLPPHVSLLMRRQNKLVLCYLTAEECENVYEG